ncbi:MAG: DUF2208 domain-containing protein [Hymenobacter sp.]|nr:MAG: DUF2208 domain-containing protein [Hymenobacter sp.]
MHPSFKEYLTISLKHIVRHQKWRLLLFPLGIIIAILAQPYSHNADSEAYPISNTETIGLFIFCSLLVVVMAVVAVRWTFRRRYNQIQFLQKPADYTFTETGIGVKTPDISGFSSWQTINTLFLMNDWALLTTHNLTGYFLDFRCLEAPATQADFLALLQQHQIPVS